MHPPRGEETPCCNKVSSAPPPSPSPREPGSPPLRSSRGSLPPTLPSPPRPDSGPSRGGGRAPGPESGRSGARRAPWTARPSLLRSARRRRGARCGAKVQGGGRGGRGSGLSPRRSCCHCPGRAPRPSPSPRQQGRGEFELRESLKRWAGPGAARALGVLLVGKLRQEAREGFVGWRFPGVAPSPSLAPIGLEGGGEAAAWPPVEAPPPPGLGRQGVRSDSGLGSLAGISRQHTTTFPQTRASRVEVRTTPSEAQSP